MSWAERRFLTDEEVDEFDGIVAPVADAMKEDVALVDQIRAAHSDSVGRFLDRMPGMLARQSSGAFGVIDSGEGGRRWRDAVRMLIAASSAGITHLCEHAWLVRPQWVTCDPPAVMCLECVKRDPDGYQAQLKAMGHRWDHECDRCGAHSEMMTSVTIGGPAYLTLFGHICSDCRAKEESYAMEHDELVIVRRSHPRPGERPGARGRRNRKR